MNGNGTPASAVRTTPWQSYDDVAVGEQINGFGRTISDAEIVMITALTTGFHQPIHTNVEHVRAHTHFSGLLLPGPIIVSYAIGLLSATLVYSGITVAFLGIDKVRAKAPVHGGDTITSVATVVSKRLTSTGDNGVVELAIEVRKQDASVVMTFMYTLMVRAGAAKAPT